MITVSLRDDAPLGPNDLRFEIAEEIIERLHASAAANGQAWEDIVVESLLGAAKPGDRPNDAALGAVQHPAVETRP